VSSYRIEGFIPASHRKLATGEMPVLLEMKTRGVAIFIFLEIRSLLALVPMKQYSNVMNEALKIPKPG
jgi:hypothetical protein